ncbi:hypothetical protein LIER_13840 [Lithospermum erythrorhizon]|uniref:Uncharacterized protein n=1 Tax=Lithospermum erythrorhizon TaxID=34254 RepID=A0AAV3PWV3_LITER
MSTLQGPVLTEAAKTLSVVVAKLIDDYWVRRSLTYLMKIKKFTTLDVATAILKRVLMKKIWSTFAISAKKSHNSSKAIDCDDDY